MSNGKDMFTANMDAVGMHARGQVNHVQLLKEFTLPESDGGPEITPAEWARAIKDAEEQAREACEELVPLAKGLVLLERVRNNIKHRLADVLSLPLDKDTRYIALHHFGLVGPRGGPRAKKEAPVGATNSAGLDRQLG